MIIQENHVAGRANIIIARGWQIVKITAVRFTSVSRNIFSQVVTEITSFGFRPVKIFLETGSLNAVIFTIYPPTYRRS